MTIAYQGAPGAFGHQAAAFAFPDADMLACATFPLVVASVSDGRSEFGILPIENRYAGQVHGVAKLILASGLEVVRLFDLPIRLHLLGLAGSRLDDIRSVASHPMALRQCRISLAGLGLTLVEAANTAIAAQTLTDRSTTVLASEEAAQLYQLTILARDLQDDPDNTTTFAVLRRR